MQVIFSDSCRLLPARIAVKFSMSAVWHAQPGEQVRITGKVNEFKGNLQIKLDGPEALKTQKSDPALFKPAAGAAAGSPQAAAPAAKLGDIAGLGRDDDLEGDREAEAAVVRGPDRHP